MSKKTAVTFSNYEPIEKRWLQLDSGDEALYEEFTYMKGKHPFKAFRIFTGSPTYLFSFDISGNIKDIEEFEKKQLTIFLCEFNPGIQ